ncbi:MAG TPA: glycerophosphodiester phosphodiesterase [Gammaproteobacteria bacterium]|nr:glycerophosphodiester phosphodiesterase [Gammaproteobacteria bacterium]
MPASSPSAKVVIAHRGASGYLPEHTREAKMLAYGQGADFLEQDVVATRDRALVVLHDIFLDDVSNVAECFPQRRRPDGRFYVVDFDLNEIERLRLHERRRPGSVEPLYQDRFRDEAVSFRVVTLDEEIRLVRELNRQTGREVGIYPEIKRPDWHREHGIDLASLLLTVLAGHGYRDEKDPVFVQCFDAAELKRCRRELGTCLKLVQLVERGSEGEAMLTREGLSEIASYAEVVAPSFGQIGAPAEDGGLRREEWVAALAPLRLGLHTYTFRRERVPAGVRDLEALVRAYFSAVDGLFCDQPDVAVAVRDRLAGEG